MSRSELASALNVDVDTVRQWEVAIAEPVPRILPRLAATLGIDVNALHKHDTAVRTLRDLRRRAGLNQADVGRAIGVSTSMISSAERGLRTLPAELAKGLAATFDVGITEVLAALDHAAAQSFSESTTDIAPKTAEGNHTDLPGSSENNERTATNYAIQLADGRLIRYPHLDWTREQAGEYLAALREQASSEDGMGDDLEEIFGPVLDDYTAILAGAQVIPMRAAPLPSDDQPVEKDLDVQFRGESKRIVAGHPNASHDSLIGTTTDVTDNALRSVAEYVIHAFSGAAEIEYDDGVIYQVQVVKIGQPRQDGRRYALHPGGMIVGISGAAI
ncbi:Predicted transcriptional regulator [Mycobacteroides abscessus subsp. massiliense]|nr:helix-turn-helix transcriptional regulator [Mycobacteroides abscessus]SLH39688.1 Predicted transcriptional regulator [Mycobacteroides abscessus subsp. massiliense]